MRQKKKTRADFEVNYVGCEVRVNWTDVLHIEGDMTLREVKKEPPIVFESYGLVVDEDEKVLTVACTVGKDKKGSTLRDTIKFPKRYINKITIMEEGLST